MRPNASIAARTSAPVRKIRTRPPKRSLPPANSSTRKPGATTLSRRKTRLRRSNAASLHRIEPAQVRPYQAGPGIFADTSPVSIAIDDNAVAVCFSIPSITQKTSAATTATCRPALITRARQIRRSPAAGDNKFNLYSAVSAGWPRDVAAAIVVALSTRKAVTPPWNKPCCCKSSGRRSTTSVHDPRTSSDSSAPICGPLCGSCRPEATRTCSICGRLAPAVISKLTGQPCCHACMQRRARCTGCGIVKPIRSGTLTEPRCATCTRPDASWHACPGCGEHTQHRSRRCARCSMQQRLGELLRDNTGKIHPQLQVLHDNLANHDRPNTVLAWLNKDATTTVLRGLAAGQRALTHAGLDELPDAKPLRQPAQRPGRHRRAAAPRRTADPPRALDHHHHRRAPRPATAAPLRHLARAAPAAAAQKWAARQLRRARRRPATRQSRDHAAGLAHQPRPHPGYRAAR